MNYTPGQLEAVKRIQVSKDYYEMLGVAMDATDDDIKKAYKQLALKLHPDKNKAPGATEAFKAVGTASAILIDEETRKQYDYSMTRMGDHEYGHASYSQAFANTSEEDWILLGLGAGLGALGGFMLYKQFFGKKRSDQ